MEKCLSSEVSYGDAVMAEQKNSRIWARLFGVVSSLLCALALTSCVTGSVSEDSLAFGNATRVLNGSDSLVYDPTALGDNANVGGPHGTVGPGTGQPAVFSPTNTTTNQPIALQSINVTPDPASVAVNSTVQLSISGVQQGGQTVNVVATTGVVVSFTAANPAVATVSNAGLVTGVTAGNTTVNVTVTSNGSTLNDTVSVLVSASTPPGPTPPTPPPNVPPPLNQRLFVSSADGNLRALNPDNYTIIEQSTPSVARNMGFMTFSTANQHVIVGLIGPTGGAVQFQSLDLPAGEGAINTQGTSTFDVAFDTINEHLYAVNFSTNTVVELDTTTTPSAPFVENTIPVTGPRQLEYEAGRQLVYVSNHAVGASALTIIAAPTFPLLPSLVSTTPTGDGNDEGEAVAVDAGRNRVYMSNVDGDATPDTVSVFDVSNASAPVLAQSITAGLRPVSIAVDRDHDRVYVLNRDSGTLNIYDAFNNLAPSSIRASITVGAQPSDVIYDSFRDRIIVANQGAGNVTVYDAVTLSPVPLFTTPVTSPAGLLLAP